MGTEGSRSALEVGSGLSCLGAGAHYGNSRDWATKDDRYHLMEDFDQPDPSRMHFPFLFDLNADFKFSPKGGGNAMSDDLLDIYNLLYGKDLKDAVAKNTSEVTAEVTSKVTESNAAKVAARFGVSLEEARSILK